jgi:MFS family permease
MATAASLPFFLFTFPAGALADLMNRRPLFIATYLWLGLAAGLLAVLSWLHFRGWPRHRHNGANYSSGKSGRVLGSGERASADVFAQ